MASSSRSFILYALRAMPCATSSGFHTTRGARWFHTKPAGWITKKGTFGRQKFLFCWHVLTEKMPLIFSLTKSFSSAIWTFCDARIIEMDCNIYLIPFGFEFGFTFWTNVCFRYYNYIQDNKQDKYGNGYKTPRDIEMATKPIHLTGWEHKSWDK